MRDATELEKIEAQAMCDAVARSMKTRKKSDADGADALTFSGEVNFSDNRPADEAEFNFDDYNKKAKADTAIFSIKRLVARSGVADSVKQFLTQRNEVIKRNKERKAEAAKLNQST